MPEYKVQPKYLDERPGMLRSLDFTPSTDMGQRYYFYKSGIPGDKSSASIGYHPAFNSISHLNNPTEYKVMPYRRIPFDPTNSAYTPIKYYPK